MRGWSSKTLVNVSAFFSFFLFAPPTLSTSSGPSVDGRFDHVF